MREISRDELIKVLIGSSAKEVGLVTETELKLKKRGNPLASARVTKIKSAVYQFGGDFGARLKNALNEEVGADVGEVTTHSLPWGEWHNGAEGKVIDYQGNLYLRHYNAIGNVVVQYSVNGNAPTDDDLVAIKEFSPKRSNTTYTTENCGEVENTTLVTQSINFDRILLLTIDGMIYKVA